MTKPLACPYCRERFYFSETKLIHMERKHLKMMTPLEREKLKHPDVQAFKSAIKGLESGEKR